MENNNIPLASEIIHIMKKVIYFLIVLELLTIAGFIWYMSLPTEDTYIENQDGNANYIGNDLNGVINNGDDTSKEENSKK